MILSNVPAGEHLLSEQDSKTEPTNPYLIG